MITYFVTRHKGAIEWARAQGIEATLIHHLDPDTIKTGDAVLGTLPVNIAAEVCARGGRYFHLSLNLPPEARGHELSANDMEHFGAILTEFCIRRCE